MANVKETLTKLVDKFKGRSTLDEQSVKNFKETVEAAKQAASEAKAPKA